MTSSGRAWVLPARLAAAAAFAVTALLPAPCAGQVWSDRMLGIPGVRQDLGFSQLLGPWIRTDSYSEHPERKIDALGLDREDDLSTVRLLAQAFAESNATLMIRILEKDVVLLDSRGITLAVPYNGRQRRLGGGVRGRVLEFFLDDTSIRLVRKRPFRTRIRLAEPPRQQKLEVLAYGRDRAYLGRDEYLLNEVDRPFVVRIAAMSRFQADGNAAIRVAASLSLPRTATLEQVDFYRSDALVEAVRDFGREATAGAPRTIQVAAVIDGGLPDDFIRVVARLADGREREDAQLLHGADYQSEIDIQLAQFQVLVTDRDGDPVSGLSPEDFEIREHGRRRPAIALHTAYDVPLVLGLAVDSSDSMLPTWSRLKYIARSFLATAVTPDDRAFLVDFDDTVRLVQPLTRDRPLLSERLDRMIPMGGTALNDGLLFSLLQYGSEPGRRALVVITDGADQHSRSNPEQS
ncbi:MAG: VWA domain-containing protein, partial [Acidobacteriota bacterium]|nr:VWA domain-containing protein [Acidobacteriota bacterium]